MMKMKGICNTVANYKKTCAVLALVGGLHMTLSENQPVLGMIDLPTITFMGKTVGVQNRSRTRPRCLRRLLFSRLYVRLGEYYGY